MNTALLSRSILAALLIAAPFSAQTPKPRKFEVRLPNPRAITGNRLACSAVATSVLIGNGPGSIIGHIGGGTDEIAIKVGEKNLTFTTAASVKAGFAEGADFSVVHNTPEALHAMAYDPDVTRAPFSTLTVNKRNGYGIWTKSRAAGMVEGKDVPDSQTMYLACR